MQKYDIKKLQAELIKYESKLEPYQKAEIAALEMCSTTTIIEYLKGGKIATPALATAILCEAKRILKNG